jgi:hypothetical protein
LLADRGQDLLGDFAFSQRAKYQSTVSQGGKSFGNWRHEQPVRTT